MLFAVLSGFVLALLAPWLTRVARPWIGWLLALLPFGLAGYFFSFLPQVASGATLREAWPWLPDLGISLAFYLDGLSLVFALLITGIGGFILIYAGGYLKGHPQHGRFMSFLLLFMGSMLGLVLADDLITLFVFWELTSITSFLLIGFEHERPESRRAAVQALVVTGLGGLALLAGGLILAQEGGFLLSGYLEVGTTLAGSEAYPAILVLFLIAAFTKSAQVPLHFWLPNAMEAPTPVSAYLHSATMVKAGVYLLARMNPLLGGTEAWTLTLVIFGGATFLVGTLLALRQSDYKLLLAYTTVASLGLLVMLIGLGSEKAVEGAMLYLIAHAFFKGGLFMVAGCVDHEAGTRNLDRLGGLARAMPITAAAAGLAALSMGGLPPFAGFLAKESLYKGTLLAGQPWLVSGFSLLVNALMFAAAGVAFLRPFTGKRPELPKRAHEGPPSLWLGALFLAVLGLAAGLLPGPFGTLFVAPSMSAVLGHSVELHLALWHGVNAPLLLSLATFALGGLLLWRSRAIRDAVAGFLRAVGWGPDLGYDQVMIGLGRLGAKVTPIIQSGLLRRYVMITMTVMILALLWGIGFGGAWPEARDWQRPRFYEIGTIALIIGAALIVVLARSRLAQIAAAGAVGYGVALFYLLFGAPDLAFTQFMVETLSVVIIVLILLRLPIQERIKRSRTQRLREGTMALVLGAGVTLFLMGVTDDPLDQRISEYYLRNSVPEAHGHNVVNVILVDFRALDTLGEITVVLIAGVSALVALRFRPGRRR